MQNNRNYGFNQYQQYPTSSTGGWTEETEWSKPDESWRGAEKAQPLPYDTWKQRNPDPPPRNDRDDRDFRYGRDRAPNPIDNQFLGDLGAKRLNNGNLVDRNGYTLRTRDPECSAPSPPKFNPRKQKNVEKKVEKVPEVAVLSQEELDRKVKQQLEMMENMKKEEERAQKEQRRRERVKQEVGGEDEYEDVEPVPEEPVPPKVVQEEEPPAKKFTVRDDNWYSVYKKRVDAFKEQVYGPAPTSSYSSPSQKTGYFFPSAPPTASPVAAYHSSPVAPYHSSPGAPYHSSPSSSSSAPPIRRPPQMDLPPPGIISDSMFQPRQREIPPYQPPQNLANIDAFGVRFGSRPPVVTDPSDSEEEDEAMVKLREIMNAYGPQN